MNNYLKLPMHIVFFKAEIIKQSNGLLKRYLRTGCFGMLFLCGSFSPIKAEGASLLLPHRAEYSIQLHSKDKESSIKDVRGTLVIEIRDMGEKYAFEQRSVLTVLFDDNTSRQYMADVKNEESKDGTRYQFVVKSFVNGAIVEELKGSALAATDAAGQILFEKPTSFQATLPKGTLFPLQHFLTILKAAIKGETVVSDKIVFDGANNAQKAVDVNAVIATASASHLVLDNPSLLKADKAWSCQMAIFGHDSSQPDPDSEIEQTFLESGVTTSMIMNYGDQGFSVKLILERIDVFNTSEAAPVITSAEKH